MVDPSFDDFSDTGRLAPYGFGAPPASFTGILGCLTAGARSASAEIDPPLLLISTSESYPELVPPYPSSYEVFSPSVLPPDSIQLPPIHPEGPGNANAPGLPIPS